MGDVVRARLEALLGELDPGLMPSPAAHPPGPGFPSHPPSVWIVIFFQVPVSGMRRTSVVPSCQSRNFAAARQHPNGNWGRTCWQGSSVKSEGEVLLGSPAIDAKEYLRAYAMFKKLHKNQ